MGLLKSFGLIKPAGIPPYVIILCDNQSVLHIIANGEGFSGKSRHMRVRWFFTFEIIAGGMAQLEYVPTEENWADLPSKPTGGRLFILQRNNILAFDVWEEVVSEEEKI